MPRPLLFFDRPERKAGRCFDCDRVVGSYIVRNEVWDDAWPGYIDYRNALSVLYKNTLWTNFVDLHLCLRCLAHRVGRPLTFDDFDLRLPINAAILLGKTLAEAK